MTTALERLSLLIAIGILVLSGISMMTSGGCPGLADHARACRKHCESGGIRMVSVDVVGRCACGEASR